MGIDQCKHCTLRGNIQACESVPCSQREHWWGLEKIAENEQLKAKVERLTSRGIQDMTHRIQQLELALKTIANDGHLMDCTKTVSIAKEALQVDMEVSDE